MSPEEKQRMIHIRIDNGVHKELRKVAAEYDLTIQEIVSGAVEETVEDHEIELQLERRREKLERRHERIERRAMEIEKRRVDGREPITVEIESEFEVNDESQSDSLMAKLLKIEKSVDTISIQIEELKAVLGTRD